MRKFHEVGEEGGGVGLEGSRVGEGRGLCNARTGICTRGILMDENRDKEDKGKEKKIMQA